jgi:PTH1 family peptidyl-tRNA hydrolase
VIFSRKSAFAWIAVFLGNPGARFENTRHNAGFMAADAIERSSGVRINRLKFGSLTASAAFAGRNALLLKPQTYMNLSGDAVRKAMNFYKVPLSNVVVISDDVSLPAGKLRVRRSGSSGGHNGLKDIITKCGGDGFPRVKIGVGSAQHDGYELIDWVLAKMSADELAVIAQAAARAAGALESIITKGVEAAMAEYN